MFKLNVLTPERKAIFDQEVTEVIVPARSGEMTILPGHAPLITTLGTGIFKYKVKGQDRTHRALISWGYCEINPEGVNVLAEFVQYEEEVSVDAAKAKLAGAEKKLATEVLTDAEFENTQAEAARAYGAIELTKH